MIHIHEKMFSSYIRFIGSNAADVDAVQKAENIYDVYVCTCWPLPTIWLATEIQSQCTFVYVKGSLLSNSYFAHYLCILSCSETVVETKHECGPQGDQRFNLTRWDKLEKDFDFPLCFATRKADFFSRILSLLEKAEIRPSPEKWAGVAIYKHVWLYYKPT